MLPDAFPCDSQYFKFSMREDLSADVNNHVTSMLKRRGRDNGQLGAKTSRIVTCYTFETIAMPRKSKSAMSRLQNLGSNAKKRPSVTIEDLEDGDGMVTVFNLNSPLKLTHI